MAINPLQLMQLQKMFETFRQNHPKLPLFFQAVSRDALVEGTILEMTAKSPNGKKYCTNIRLSASDIEMIQALKQMKKQN